MTVPSLQMDVSAAVTSGVTGAVNYKVRGDFTGDDSPAKFDVRWPEQRLGHSGAPSRWSTAPMPTT